MDFFNKHLSTSIVSSIAITPSSKGSRFQEFLVPLRPAPLLVTKNQNAHPLASSTPVQTVAININGAHSRGTVQKQIKMDSGQKQQLVSIEKQSRVPLPSASNVSQALVSAAGSVNPKGFEHGSVIALRDNSVDIAQHQQSSTESQMEMLYESLQSEAQKIQKFKVHAMAQIKQKSDEINMKESQIKNLSSELSTTRSKNNELTSRLLTQKNSNEAIMNKVATTREMCFSLAEDQITLKGHVNMGADIYQEIAKKYSSHSNYIKKAVENVDQYQASTEERLTRIEQEVEDKEIAHCKRLKVYAEKESLLLVEIAEKVAASNELQEAIDKYEKDYLVTKKDLAEHKSSSLVRQNELEAAMEELSLTKDSELTALRCQLTEAVSSSATLREKWLTERENLKLELEKCQTDWKASSLELQEEASKREQTAAEKVACEEQLAAKESYIADIIHKKSELEQEIEKCEDILKTQTRELEQSKLELEQTQAASSDVEAALRLELSERAKENEALNDTEEELRTNIAKLNSGHHELQMNCESLQSTNTAVRELLQAAEDEVASKNELVEAKNEEIKGLNVMLEKTAMETTANHSSLNQMMTKLQEKVSDLELQLNTADNTIDELRGNLRETIANSDVELSALKDSKRAQQHDFECTIKHKTDAFTAVQNELQRLLDEAIATGKEKLSSLQVTMNSQQQGHELEMKVKVNAFTEAQKEMQRMLDESEKKLEQDNLKVEDLNQDLTITKQSLDKSLEEKNQVALVLAQKTQELQEVSNKLLVKDCEFSKLMAAVHNLKERWAAVATPMTPLATPPSQVAPQQAAIRPTSYSTPLASVAAMLPSTPTHKSVTPVKGRAGSTTPQKATSGYHNTTPRSAGSIRPPPCFSTPRTPNSSLSSDNPKGILRSEGSASKPNRVVFSTPIEQKSVVPSDSDTSVFDMEMVNKSLQLKTTPECKSINISQTSNNSLQLSRNSAHTPRKGVATPTQGNSKGLSVTPRSQTHLNNSISPALSSQSGGDRLPRSKMIKASGRKRLRLAAGGKIEEMRMMSKAMTKHRALMEHGRPMNSAKPIRESDSDCFGFGSE